MGEHLRVALAAVALVGSGIFAGVFFAVRVSVLPALCTLPADRYIELHKLLGKGYHPAMPLIVNSTMLAQVGLAILDPDPTSRVLLVVAVLLTLAVQTVSHLANVPINRQLLAVDPRNLPADWEDPRPRWQSWHDLRTALALGAVLLTALAVGR